MKAKKKISGVLISSFSWVADEKKVLIVSNRMVVFWAVIL